MSRTVIEIENVSKIYRLGTVGFTSIIEDVNRAWARFRGLEDPYQKIALINGSQQKDSNYVWSLKDVYLTISQGQAVGIVGKNGAGKSTLLKLISRITAPTTGTIKIKGRIASLLEVGTGFHPELTGRENIYLNGTIMGLSRRDITSRLDQIIDFSGVEQYIDTPVKRYSSGMYVRLAFAVSAHLEPDILIVDEVLAVGDAEFQKKCLGKMQEVNDKEGRTLLFVSHNIPSLKHICTSGVLLENGTVTLQGRIEDVLNTYLQSSASSSDEFNFDENRKGNGLVRLKKLSFINLDTSGNAIQTGARIQIVCTCDSSFQATNDLLIRLIIKDIFGNILFICNNEYSYKMFDVSEGENTYRCTIPKWPLNEGKYRVECLIFSNSFLFLDIIESGIDIAVIENDFFGTGKLPALKSGVLVDQRWTHEK